MAIAFVQAADNDSADTFSAVTVTLGATPTDGNLLVAAVVVRNGAGAYTWSGWTLIESAITEAGLNQRSLDVYYRIANGDVAAIASPNVGSHYKSMTVAEFSGVSAFDVSDAISSQSGSALSVGPITPSAGAESLLFYAFAVNTASTGYTPGAGYTEISDTDVGGGQQPSYETAYRILTPPSGAYTPTATAPASNAWGGIVAAFYGGPSDSGGYADWDEDGFSVDDGLPLISMHIQQGASAEITGATQPGQASIVVRNTDDDYNPANSGSPLYGKTVDGIPLHLSVNADGALTGTDPRGLFGGRIKDIEPNPVGGATSSPTVTITAEDAIGWYSRVPVSLAFAEGRSHKAFREALLTAAGETRYSLADERQTMPLSNADGDLLPLLEQVNKATGTRHFVLPKNSPSAWYEYTTRNRYWRLDGTSDASLDMGDYGADASGWRLSADTVINRQRATVTPVVFTSAAYVVWQPEVLPIEVTERRPYIVWVEFDDYVRNPVLNLAYSGSTLAYSLTPFGQTAKIEITRTGAGTGTVTALSIEGQLARRLANETATADDTTSQAGTRGIRAGSEISGFAVGSSAQAAGIANHMVWRYGNPQFRPTLTVSNWIPEMFELRLFDIIDLTGTQLGLSGRLFEIVGRTLDCSWAASATEHLHVGTFVLQECRVQTPTDWFTLDSSLLDGTDDLHY